MSQPITGSGQRTISQPLFIPTLMPMHSLPQQAVMTSGNGVVPSGNGMASVITTSNRVAIPVITTAVFGGQTQKLTGSVQEQVTPLASLYLCNTNNATDSALEENTSDLAKTSVLSLKESFKELNSRKIKSSLSSFLLDVPGEFDCTESPDTMLRHLLDQRLVRNDFHPLSGHALLGFRLLPGSLPEQARIDPPMGSETRPQHRKRKHKHRTLEKVGEDGLDLHLPSSKVKMPSDVYSFVKPESSSSVILTSSPAIPHGFPGLVERALPSSMQKVVPSQHGYPQAVVAGPPHVGVSSTTAHDPMNPFPGGKKKKEKKRNKEKKKEKKEKKKKKHHNSQDLPVGQASQVPPPSLSTHAPSPYSMP